MNKQEAAQAAPWEEILNFLQQIVFGVPRFIGAVLVFIFSIWLARLITRIILNRLSEKLGNDESTAQVLTLIKRTVSIIVIMLGGLLALSILGFSDITAIFGFFGLGLGFAFKDLLANLIAGVVILTQKKYKIGDFVKIGETEGYITEIETRTTQMQDLNGSLMVVPNSDMLTNMVRNYTHNSFRRIDVTVGIHYDDDMETAKTAIIKALKSVPEVVVKPEPKALFKEFASCSINLDVRFWVESTSFWFQARSDVIEAIKREFDAAGITIPFPIRTLALDKYDPNVAKVIGK